MNRGAWKATVHGISKSWTWLSDWAPVPIRRGGPWTRLVLAWWKVEMSLLICEWISGNLVSWLQERAESGAVLVPLLCSWAPRPFLLPSCLCVSCSPSEMAWNSICYGWTVSCLQKLYWVLTPRKVKVAQLCPTLWDPMDYTYSPWNSPGQNTGVGSHSLLQGIFPIQWSNPGLLHCRQILDQLSHQGMWPYLEIRSLQR